MPIIRLMRNDVYDITTTLESANAGLLMQKGLREWEDDEEKKRLRARTDGGDKRTAKEKLIDTIASVRSNDLYQLAFERWLNLTYSNEDEGINQESEFRHLSATVNGRLFTGLALGGAIETGAMVHHTYGMPMIAGSSIKGAVRNYAENLYVKRLENGEIDYRIEIKNGKEIKHLQFDDDKQAILNVLFGKDSDENADAGFLIWHDAWWIPNVKNEQNPFVGEIVTVHHQNYYQGELDEALDIENPVPNQQIAMIGSFYFTIQGDKAWADYALELLKGALQYQGLGAKGSNGYGYFDKIDSLEIELKNRYLANQPVDENDPLGDIKKAISLLSDEKLQESLSKGLNKFFENLGLNKENDDDCKKVIQVLYDERAEFIDGLNNDSGKNAQKALKFIEKYRG